MERKLPLDRRYSLNATQMKPIAESTCLNLNDNSSQILGNFPWGVQTLSPKHERTENSYRIMTNEKKQRMSELREATQRKIAPRIYTDVQSRGLSSRIVKYQGNNTNVNRNVLTYNMSHRPGQFPLVHVKQTPLPIRAIKHTISKTYIAPPDKTTFQGNTLSSLLRSNSILGLQRDVVDVSHENRPILHPPSTKDDIAPTRSVLDVLKEISRKRINSEDLNSDEMAFHLKRQRDVHMNNASTTPLVTNTSMSAHVEQQNTTPTQARKRLCKYVNNDITSSLSSTMKRKLSCKPEEEFSNQTKSPPQNQRTKVLKTNCPTDQTAQNALKPDANMNLPIKQISNILPVQSKSCPIMLNVGQHSEQSKRIEMNGIVKEMSDTRNYYEESNINYNNSPKPLTLFNKNYNTAVVNNMCNEDFNSDEGDKTIFVKPRKHVSFSNNNRTLIAQRANSILARMLNSLSDALHDESDNNEQLQQNENDVNLDTESSTTTTTINSVVNVNHAVSNAAITSLSITSTTLVTKTITTPITTASIMENTKKTSPLVGIKLNNTNIVTQTALSTASNTLPTGFSFQPSSITSTATPSSITTTPSLTVPNITFGFPTNSSEASKTQSNTISVTSTTAKTSSTLTSTASTLNHLESIASVSGAATLLTTTVTNTVANTLSSITTPASTNNFTFGFNKQIEKTNEKTPGTSTDLISFNSFTEPSTSTSKAPITSQTLNPTANLFNFTSNTNKPNGTTTISNNFVFTPTTVAPVTAVSQADSVLPNPTTKPDGGGFSFNAPVKTNQSNNNNNDNTKITGQATPFNFGGNVGTVSNFSTGGFNFNSSMENTTQNSNNNNNSKPSATAAPFNFGNVVNTSLIKSNDSPKTFTFGVSNSTNSKSTPQNLFNFGNTPKATSTTSSAISATNTATVAATTTTTTSTSTTVQLTTTTVTSSFMQVSNTFNTFADMVKKPSTSVFNSAVQPTFSTVSNLNTLNKNVTPIIFGSNTNNTPMTLPSTFTPSTSTVSLFGSSTTTTNSAAPQMLDTKKGFSFGSAITNTNNTTFGNLSQSASGGITTSTNSTITNIFAPKTTNATAGINQSKTFAFGNTMTAQKTNENLFKEPSKPLNTNPTVGGFAFGSTSFVKPQTSVPSSGPVQGSNTFSFSNNNNPNNAVPAAPASASSPAPAFTFGATTIPKMASDIGSGSTTINKPFTFGSTTSMPNSKSLFNTPQTSGMQAPNIFGMPKPSASTPAPTFAATSSGVVGSAPLANANNIFDTNSTNTIPEERQIKRATRRLQK